MVGGTRFVGRHVVEAALQRGHEVTLLHRGRTNAELFPGVEHILADRDDGLAGWRTDVRRDGRRLRLLPPAGPQPARAWVTAPGTTCTSPACRHTPSRCRSTTSRPPRWPPSTIPTPTSSRTRRTAAQGRQRGAGHRAVWPDHPARRPTYVVGPDDYTWRFPYWVSRIAAGGDVLAPGPADDPAQVIDVRDQGDWMVRLLENGRRAPFTR